MKITLPAILALLVLPAFALAEDEKDHMQRMAQEHKHDKPTATPAAMAEPARPVTAEEVTYGTVDGKPVRGYLARPKDAKGTLPGLLVIHEWWGLNDNIRAMTRRLAGEGYQALAVDLMGGAVAETPDAAMKQMEAVSKDRASAEDNLRDAYAFLEKNGAPKIGVIGWCFGGGWSLNTAMLLPDKIDAVVIYYGGVTADKGKLTPIQAPILGLFGGKDKGIPVEGVRAFEKSLKELNKNAVVQIYEDADHAFANASGGNYNAEAAKDAWQRTTAFLGKHLK
ncbi:MAG TPA: dienelactone hydrolase family protein [Thermoanaerobaculia bacterium]|nr:dienelactone hydrolase family protein [Thermoanaerobaculia bacterium]